MTYLLYPSSPLRAQKPDEQFADEVEAVRAAGFETALFSLESFQSGEFQLATPIQSGSKVLYRGWMLSGSEYEKLVSQLTHVGVTPLISTEAYLASHHLPRWYPQIADFTPETRVFSRECDLEKELKELSWQEYFIKDYVKSLKTSIGSVITDLVQVKRVVAEMEKYRGTIEGGFCVRRVEKFVPESERRYFVIDGVPHAPEGEVPDIVHECAKRLKQRFYSIDVTGLSDGRSRVVEVGDGQVSDLVGWNPEAFARILVEHLRD